MASITTDGSTTAGASIAQTLTNVFEVSTARQLSYGATTANLALTTTCRFITIIAAGGTHVHYQIGVGAQTATTTSHYLPTGQRITLTVPPNANIAAIQGSAAGTLYISELTQ
jgi:hypothetical protein